jgi:hypothetical protein
MRYRCTQTHKNNNINRLNPSGQLYDLYFVFMAFARLSS